MYFLGIDPGKGGGLALLNQDGDLVMRETTPVIGARGAKTSYNIGSMWDCLIGFKKATGDVGLVATIEKTQPFPGNGASSNHAIGFGDGIWQALLTAMSIRYDIVGPRTWQKVLFKDMNAATSDTKAASAIYCARRWGSHKFLATERSKKPHDGLTDAACIAEYGRVNLNGGMVK